MVVSSFAIRRQQLYFNPTKVQGLGKNADINLLQPVFVSQSAIHF
jgi:hypothetical protein